MRHPSNASTPERSLLAVLAMSAALLTSGCASRNGWDSSSQVAKVPAPDATAVQTPPATSAPPAASTPAPASTPQPVATSSPAAMVSTAPASGFSASVDAIAVAKADEAFRGRYLGQAPPAASGQQSAGQTVPAPPVTAYAAPSGTAGAIVSGASPSGLASSSATVPTRAVSAGAGTPSIEAVNQAAALNGRARAATNVTTLSTPAAAPTAMVNPNRQMLAAVPPSNVTVTSLAGVTEISGIQTSSNETATEIAGTLTVNAPLSNTTATGIASANAPLNPANTAAISGSLANSAALSNTTATGIATLATPATLTGQVTSPLTPAPGSAAGINQTAPGAAGAPGSKATTAKSTGTSAGRSGRGPAKAAAAGSDVQIVAGADGKPVVTNASPSKIRRLLSAIGLRRDTSPPAATTTSPPAATSTNQ